MTPPSIRLAPPAVLVACVAFVTMVFGAACVTREHRELREAREAHRRCVAEQGEAAPRCVDLQAQLDSASQRYENSSRRAWACDPAQEECPTPR